MNIEEKDEEWVIDLKNVYDIYQLVKTEESFDPFLV